MIYALFDNCILIILSIAAAFRSEYPVWMTLIAAALLVVITAQSMGIRIGWLKWILCPVFAVLSGTWIGYLVFALLWPGKEPDPERDPTEEGKKNGGGGHPGVLSGRSILYVIPGIAAMVLYLCVQLIRNRSELNGQLIAEEFLLSLAVLAGVLILFLVKQLIRSAQRTRLQEREQLRQSTVSEMREKKLNQKLAQQSYLADKNARLTERENISRNIHNSVGHTITAAIMTLDAADMLYDSKPEEARKRMNDANERIRGSLESIRRAVRTLDQDSADVPLSDLMAGMDSIIDEFVMDTERKVDRLYDPFPEGMQLSHEHLEFLTGVLQEALTNGVKHGNADTFLVTLRGDSAHIRLSIKDNGNSDYSSENEQQRIRQGFGLKKIISYAERCGGYAEFTNDGGFRSVVELPLIISEDSQ